ATGRAAHAGQRAFRCCDSRPREASVFRSEERAPAPCIEALRVGDDAVRDARFVAERLPRGAVVRAEPVAHRIVDGQDDDEERLAGALGPDDADGLPLGHPRERGATEVTEVACDVDDRRIRVVAHPSSEHRTRTSPEYRVVAGPLAYALDRPAILG